MHDRLAWFEDRQRHPEKKYGRFETLLTDGSTAADNDKTMGRNHL
jgi:hypothetical protein